MAENEFEGLICPSCRAEEFVSVSIDHGYTRRAQCVPCGAMHPTWLAAGWRGQGKMYAVCGKEACLKTALKEMEGITFKLRNVVGRNGYRCACTDKAVWMMAGRLSYGRD